MSSKNDEKCDESASGILCDINSSNIMLFNDETRLPYREVFIQDDVLEADVAEVLDMISEESVPFCTASIHDSHFSSRARLMSTSLLLSSSAILSRSISC